MSDFRGMVRQTTLKQVCRSLGRRAPCGISGFRRLVGEVGHGFKRTPYSPAPPVSRARNPLIIFVSSPDPPGAHGPGAHGYVGFSNKNNPKYRFFLFVYFFSFS